MVMKASEPPDDKFNASLMAFEASFKAWECSFKAWAATLTPEQFNKMVERLQGYKTTAQIIGAIKNSG
jgi:hypothetical protein